jgi:hypothetical protein
MARNIRVVQPFTGRRAASSPVNGTENCSELIAEPDHLCKASKMVGGDVKYAPLLMLVLIVAGIFMVLGR